MRSRKELEEVCQKRGASLNAVEFEDVAAATDWLRASPKGKLGLAWIIPSLKTWSRLPHFNRRGRPPVRSGEYPWGLPWVKHESGEFATLQAANREVLNLIQLSKELLVHSPKVALIWMHPEELGQCGVSHPASIWQLPELRHLSRDFGLFRLAAYQCKFGESEFRAPTGILSSIPLGKAFAKGWPQFQGSARLKYCGPLPSDCECGQKHTPTDPKARSTRKLHASFVTTPFTAMLAQECVKRIFKLGLVDGGNVEAQSDDNLSSGTEAPNESDLENCEGLETRAYKWGPDLAKLQADPTRTKQQLTTEKVVNQ